MESIIVNARVPAAKREHAQPILESIGATTTDLINSAYDYLVEEGKLPCAHKPEIKKDTAGLKEFLGKSTIEIDWGEDANKDYKELIVEELERKYGSLA